MLASKLLSAAGGTETPYVDDCFQVVTRTGTGSTTTITTGFQPDLVWTKARNTTEYHCLFDQNRGVNTRLCTNATSANETVSNSLTAFGLTGFTLGSSATVNSATNTYVDWVFAKKAKFFDCGTYTGNGTAGRQIPHSLGVAPGMVIVKRTDSIGNWITWHRAFAQDGTYIALNDTAAATPLSPAPFTSTVPNASSFYVNAGTGNYYDINLSGASYVWYAFAHDTSTDGIIQCGSYAGNGSTAGPSVTLGWEPQYVLIKPSSVTGNWSVVDSMRSLNLSRGDYLIPNLSNAESTVSVPSVAPNATGFQIVTDSSYLNQSGATLVYLAIRRPNKPPTTGTQVFAIDDRNTTAPAFTAPFAPDMALVKNKNATTTWYNYSRLTSPGQLQTTNTAAEGSGGSAAKFDYSLGFSADAYSGEENIVYSWMFKRAPGVFDQIVINGTYGATSHPHNLTVAPEMAIIKKRTGTGDWIVYHAGVTSPLVNQPSLNSTAAYFANNCIPSAPTASVMPIQYLDAGTSNYSVWLFSTKAGISKVGNYTGNGSSQTIDCGFSAGCRFFLVKATSTTGDWWLYDSVRGIVSATDFALALNSTAAEVTSTDSVDPISVGIIVNQEATCSINANGVSYIYLAYA